MAGSKEKTEEDNHPKSERHLDKKNAAVSPSGTKEQVSLNKSVLYE